MAALLLNFINKIQGHYFDFEFFWLIEKADFLQIGPWK